MSKIFLAAVAMLLLSFGAFGQAAQAGTHSCEGLAQLELLGARIVSAQTVAAGAFTPSRWPRERSSPSEPWRRYRC